jgi:hypothetical protein
MKSSVDLPPLFLDAGPCFTINYFRLPQTRYALPPKALVATSQAEGRHALSIEDRRCLVHGRSTGRSTVDGLRLRPWHFVFGPHKTKLENRHIFLIQPLCFKII